MKGHSFIVAIAVVYSAIILIDVLMWYARRVGVAKTKQLIKNSEDVAKFIGGGGVSKHER